MPVLYVIDGSKETNRKDFISTVLPVLNIVDGSVMENDVVGSVMPNNDFSETGRMGTRRLSQNVSNDAGSVIPANAGIQETWDVNSPQMRLHAAKLLHKTQCFYGSRIESGMTNLGYNLGFETASKTHPYVVVQYDRNIQIPDTK